MTKPILYGAPLSPFVRKVGIFLEEKGVAFDWNPIVPRAKDETFRALSPMGLIPAYKDDRIGLCDSSVICFYLEKTYPTPALYPTDTVELVKALWFEEYFDGGMIHPMRTIYFERYGNPRFKGRPTDEALVKEALEVKLPPMLAYVESQLRPEKWAVGEAFSIADIGLSVGFANLALAGVRVDKALYPKLYAYIERVYARPSFVKTERFMQEFIPTVKVKKT